MSSILLRKSITQSCIRKDDFLKYPYCLEKTERIGQKVRAAKTPTSFRRATAAKKNFKGQLNYTGSLKEDRQKEKS